jgi:hypothetical protein
MKMAIRAYLFQARGKPVRRLASLSIALASVMFLTSCSLIFDLLDGGPSDDVFMRDKMAHIVEALNDQDAAALRAMFTDYALAEYSAEIDEGVAHLLALFPDGDVIWRDGGQPAGSGSGSNEGPKRTWLGGISDVVSSAGKEYTLGFSIFTENTIDPENVGIFRISVDPRTESQVSGAELAGCEPMDTDARAGGPPGVFIGDSGGLSRDRAAQIVAAINAQDAATLKGMFTYYARTEYATELDEGLEHLLSMFPRGEVVLQENTGGSAVCERIEGEARTVLLPTYYTVNSGGVDYRLYFADFIENTIDPENVGIYAIGAELAAECGRCVPEADLNTWGNSFDLEATARPGIYVSATYKADVRMEQIAGALNTHDAAALKAMFSADVLKQTPQLDEGLGYFLSFFPSDEITWTPDPAVTTPVEVFPYIDGGKLTERVEGNYKLSVDGDDYWLFFSDVTVDEVNPERLGVTPWVGDRSSQMSGPSGEFYSWVHMVLSDPNIENRLGVYVPQ